MAKEAGIGYMTKSLLIPALVYDNYLCVLVYTTYGKKKTIES